MQRNLEHLSFRGNASNNTSPASRIIRRTQEGCGPLQDFTFAVGSQGLSESQLRQKYGNLDKKVLFGGFADAVCSFKLTGVVIDVSTEAPTPIPKAFQKSNCVSLCRSKFNVEKYSCREPSILPTVSCRLKARINKNVCISKARAEKCFF